MSNALLTYTYDGTLEGFLCCVFDAYIQHEQPDEIAPSSRLQYRLEQRRHAVCTSETHWQRVQRGIRQKLGRLVWTKVRACFCASLDGKELLLYRYLVHGFSGGRAALNDLTHADVLPIENLYRNVGREVERMLQFTRFAKVPQGIYCATINPKHDVLPLIMSHFAARFNVQQFIIYDEVHGRAGISEKGGWYLADTTGEQGFSLPQADSDDCEYQHLWKAFYDAIAIPERRNEKLRRQLMPKRLWKNLPEMKPNSGGVRPSMRGGRDHDG
jgi:probable DNA metabolism protein